MKTMLFALSLLLPVSAFAISDKALTQVCWAIGVDKLETQVEAAGCEANLWRMQVSGIDNRWYNSSKYIWYTVKAKCAQGEINMTTLVQYHRGECQ